jgi:hypothetical protein
MQAEEIKRGLQQEARREYDKIARQYTTAGETKKELASTMRGAIEGAVEEQSAKAPEAAAAFQPVKARLSRTLEALRASEEGAARAARRKPVSLSSTIVGAGAGAATGSPIWALLSAGAHGLADARLASTLASGAHAGSKLLARASSAPQTESDPILRALVAALSRARMQAVPAGAVAEDEAP